MTDIIKNTIQYVSTKFPSVFLKYLRKQLRVSESKNSSLYEITKVAHKANTLNELYQSIHEQISQLMYADNMFIAIHNKEDNNIHFPYYVDIYDNFQDTIEEFSDSSLTCNCIHEGVPTLFTKNELLDFKRATSNSETNIIPQGTISEYWLGCPLIIGEDKIGAIVVQSYDKNNVLTYEDRDLLNFVSELVAMVIQRKRLEYDQLEYQSNLENKIRERTKELFFAKEKAENAVQIKTEFLANMSHELRTPLNAIIGFCEILIEDATETKQQGFVSDLSKIHKSGIDLLALINDILDLSKIEVNKVDINTSNFKIIDLIETVSNTLQPYAKINNNIIDYNISDYNIELNSDELKIRQILFNLLTNACKNSENSTINLKVTKSVDNNLDYINFKITDSGKGIEKERLDKIFEPFTQISSIDNNKIKGTGLGLSITKKYTELLGGHIKVLSTLNEGTTFCVSILKEYNINQDSKIIKSNEIKHENALFPQKGKILIIDDDINFLDLLERKLSKDGYLVFTANSGKIGLDKAKKLLPDIIILDIIMPDIDGWTVYQKIKTIPLLSQIPIIVATIGDYENMAQDFGVNDFLSKPISWNSLKNLIKKYNVDSKSKHILVIDDDNSTRTIIRKMLIKDGWRVDEAENGEVAFKRISKQRPELIILDLMMPVMDGFSFLRKIKKNNDLNNIPIIIVTSKDLTSEDYSYLTDNADQVIQKGDYNKNEFLEKINSTIRHNKLDALNNEETT